MERFHMSYRPVKTYVKNCQFCTYCRCSVSVLKFYNTVRDKFCRKIDLEKLRIIKWSFQRCDMRILA